MPNWKERILERARGNLDFRRKLYELARLDKECMPGTVMRVDAVTSPDWQRKAMRVDELCDEVAQRIAYSDEDPGEIAQWISYHCQEVAREASVAQVGAAPRMLFWILVSIAVGVASFFLLNRLFGMTSGVSLFLSVMWGVIVLALRFRS